MDEGIHFLILTQQLGYVSKDGRLTGIRVCPVQLGPEDASGRRIPIPMNDCAYPLGMDMVIEAIGQEMPSGLDRILQGVKVSRGVVQVKEGSFQTTRDGVFAGGDLVHGASTVVAAVRDGMKAGREIDAWLNGERNTSGRRCC
jgi:glutamate synthase (NADPH/NADH) small chain